MFGAAAAAAAVHGAGVFVEAFFPFFFFHYNYIYLLFLKGPQLLLWWFYSVEWKQASGPKSRTIYFLDLGQMWGNSDLRVSGTEPVLWGSSVSDVAAFLLLARSVLGIGSSYSPCSTYTT